MVVLFFIPAISICVFAILKMNQKKNISGFSLKLLGTFTSLLLSIIPLYIIYYLTASIFLEARVEGNGSAEGAYGFVIAILIYICSMLFLLATYVKKVEVNKVIKIVFVILIIVMFMPPIYYDIDRKIYEYKEGIIGGISKWEAKKIAKESLPQNIEYKYSSTYNDSKYWIVKFEVKSDQKWKIAEKDVTIYKKNGEIVPRDKTSIQILKNNEPVGGVHVLLSLHNNRSNKSKSELLESIYTPYRDYGITDKNGETNIEISHKGYEVYSISIYNGYSKYYLCFNDPLGDNYIIDLDKIESYITDIEYVDGCI